MLCDSNADEAKQDRYLTLLAEQRVYGVLIVPVGPYAAQMRRLRERRLPFVLLDTKSLDKNVCSVSVDDVVVAGWR